jgi:hypothetical protein
MPEVQRIWTINGVRPLNPQILAIDAQENGWPTDWYGLANGITVPRGWEAGVGHFLLKARDADSLANAGQFEIVCNHEGGTTRFPKWYFESRVAITKQANPAYWVKVRDLRWHLSDVSTQGLRFNLLKAESEYVEDSTNSGTPWTWAQVISSLWSLLPSEAGSVPSLTYSPATTPENLAFDGIPALRAIQQVLTAVGCCLVFDPLLGTFRIANLRHNPTLPLSAMRSRLLWHDRRVGAGDIPANAAIRFPILPADNEYKPFLEPPHIETKSIGGSGSGQWDVADTMFYDPSRSTAITARANEIATSLTGLLHPIDNPFGATYAGIFPYVIYERLTSVEWVSDGYEGMVTRFSYKPQEIDWPVLPIAVFTSEPEENATTVVAFTLSSSLAVGLNNTATATVIASNSIYITVGTTITVRSPGGFRGASGALGVAVLSGGVWAIVQLDQAPLTAKFQFTADTHAAPVDDDFGSVATQNAISHTAFSVLTPFPFGHLSGTAVVDNPYNLIGLENDDGVCIYNQINQHWILTGVHPAKARRFYFKLTADWPLGLRQESDYCQAIYADPINQGGDLNYGAREITLYDRWDVAHNAKGEDVGLCQYNYVSGQFDIIQVEHEMTRGRGVIDESFTGTPDEFELIEVESFDGQLRTDPLDPFIVQNEMQIQSGKEGTVVDIRYNPVSGNYYAMPFAGLRVFVVLLEEDGGDQGTAEDPPSWLYTVTDGETGVVLATNVDPSSSPHHHKRPSVGQMAKATFGYAHYNSEGTLILGWINEVPEQEACEEA